MSRKFYRSLSRKSYRFWSENLYRLKTSAGPGPKKIFQILVKNFTDTEQFFTDIEKNLTETEKNLTETEKKSYRSWSKFLQTLKKSYRDWKQKILQILVDATSHRGRLLTYLLPVIAVAVLLNIPKVILIIFLLYYYTPQHTEGYSSSFMSSPSEYWIFWASFLWSSSDICLVFGGPGGKHWRGQSLCWHHRTSNGPGLGGESSLKLIGYIG